MVKIDLHIHTNLSDGSHTITEVINNSKINNCNAISITDHEIVEDYSELAKKNSINIINGIEFNSSQKGLHILGYGIKDITKMMSYMNLLHKENEYVSYLLIKKLKSIGIDISINQVKIFLKEKILYIIIWIKGILLNI